jgi:hypothetical protein
MIGDSITGPGSGKDRRSHPRKPFQMPVTVRNDHGECQGTTRDLSSSGIFLYCDSHLEFGSKLELVIMLPADLGVGPGGWSLCEASVVRIEKADGNRLGVAAKFDRVAWVPEIT